MGLPFKSPSRLLHHGKFKLCMYIGAMNMYVQPEAAKHATNKSLLCADKYSTLERLTRNKLWSRFQKCTYIPAG